MKSKSTKVFRGLMTLSGSLLALIIGASSLANVKASFINNRLGTSNYETVKNENSTQDGIWFDSEFTNLKDLVTAKEELAIQISAEGSVLLKNENNALPLNKSSETVTLWGLNSHTPTLGGMIGSSAATNSDAGQVLYGIEEAMDKEGFTVNETMKSFYASDEVMAYARRGFGNTGHGLSPSFGMIYANPSSYAVGEAPASLYTNDVLSSATNTAAVVVISRDSSEAADYHPDMTNSTSGDSFERPLALSEYERDMIELAKANSSKVIVLINADNPMEIEELKNDDEIDSILWVGAPGANGFRGVCRVLSGEANPSGHLVDTYAVNSTSSPAMANFGVYTYTNNSTSSDPDLTSGNKGDWYVVENEGIYVGYKYYETRYEDSILSRGNATSTTGSSTGNAWAYEDEVSYPFGYGLSYTTFSQELKSVELTIGGTGKAVIEVKNTGTVAGKDVVQLYVQSPYTSGGLEKSAIQLLDFAKTESLDPNESTTVEIEFDPTYMASYDEDAIKADTTAGAWTIDAGDYYFAIGNGAHEALNNVLANKTGSTSNLVSITEDETISASNAIKYTINTKDIETYSENVENALQDADINDFIEDTVDYVSRNDWTKGFETISSITATEEMLVGLTNSKYELTENGETVTWGASNGMKAADFILTDDNGDYAGVLDFNDSKWDSLIDQITLEEACTFIEQAGDKNLEPLSSITLSESLWFDGPVGNSNDQVAGYYVRWTTDDASQPTYVEQSDEYAEYTMNIMPTEPVVGSTFSKELVEREGELFGEDSLWANSNSIAAPGLNLHRTPYCARNHEYYSEDSVLTGLLGAAVCKGGKSKGIQMMPKHYAFNHQEANRSGVSTFFNEQSGRENELRCFQESLSKNYAQGVMTGFNRIGTVFSGAHEGTQVDILRNEWGYTGWIVTDMINGADYMNWRDIVFGGGGGCLTTSAYATAEIGSMTSSENMALIAKDGAFQEKMKTILKYFVYNIVSSNTMNGVTSDTSFVYVLTWWQKALIAAQWVIGIATAGVAVTYVVMEVKNHGKEKEAN